MSQELMSVYYKYKLIVADLIILQIRGPFEKLVDWRQCAAVTQREAVTVMPSYSGGGNVEVA
jgi:hypothetical protein